MVPYKGNYYSLGRIHEGGVVWHIITTRVIQYKERYGDVYTSVRNINGSFSVVYDENRARKCTVYIRKDVVSITADYVRNVNDAWKMRRRTKTDIVNASSDCRMRQCEQRFLSFSVHVLLDSRTLTVSLPCGTINRERPPLHVYLFFIELRGSSINYTQRVQGTFRTEADNDKRHKNK